eukprot:SAG22_NODE_6823_length_807_cov_1.118644_1_plen_78_part_10
MAMLPWRKHGPWWGRAGSDRDLYYNIAAVSDRESRGAHRWPIDSRIPLEFLTRMIPRMSPARRSDHGSDMSESELCSR